MAGGLQGIGHIPYEEDEYHAWASEVLGYKALTKKAVFDTLGYKPLPTIEKMHRCRAMHRILVGGNRSGKSYGAAFEIIPYLFWLNTTGWVVSGNYDMAEEIRRKVEDILIERAGMVKVLRSDGLSYGEFSYSIKTHTFVMGGTNSGFQLKSAESPDSMHAVPLDWVVIDEAALLPYILYDTRLVPRLVDNGGWILALGTLEWSQGEWFEEFYDIGQVENDMGIVSWEHPTADNYHIHTAQGGETPEQIADMYHNNAYKVVEMNPEVEWPLKPGQQVIIWNIDMAWLEQQRSRMRPEVFAARFEAQRSTSPYLVFPDWSIKEYVDKEKASFDPDLPVYLAVDPGGTYAVAALQLKKFPENCNNQVTKGWTLCIIDEVYFQRTVTTHEVFQACQAREWWSNVARWPWPHWDPIQGAIDVTAHEQARTWEHLARDDEKVQRLHFLSRKVAIQAGIQTLQHFINTHSIVVHPKCTFWNLEMRRYMYPEPSLANLEQDDPRKKPNPKDAWNHLIKAVTYFIVCKFGYYGRSNSKAVTSIYEYRKQKTPQYANAGAAVSRYRSR